MDTFYQRDIQASTQPFPSPFMLRVNPEPQILGHPGLAGQVTLPHTPQSEEPEPGSPPEETAEEGTAESWATQGERDANS